MIATLQQQVNTMLLQQQGSRVEVARPQVFSGRMEEVSAFINAARLYIRMKMTEEVAATQVAWVLLYVQGGIAEAWKDNVVRTLSRKRFPQHSNIQPKNLQAHNKVERHSKGINKLSHVTRSGDHKNILEETRDHGTLGYSHCSNSISRAAIQRRTPSSSS